MEELRLGHKAIQDPKLEVPPTPPRPSWLGRTRCSRGSSKRLPRCFPREAGTQCPTPTSGTRSWCASSISTKPNGYLVVANLSRVNPLERVVSGGRHGHRTPRRATARHAEDDEAKQRRKQLQSRDGLERVATLVRPGDLSRRQLQGEPSSVTGPLRTCKFPARRPPPSGPPPWRRT